MLKNSVYTLQTLYKIFNTSNTKTKNKTTQDLYPNRHRFSSARRALKCIYKMMK